MDPIRNSEIRVSPPLCDGVFWHKCTAISHKEPGKPPHFSSLTFHLDLEGAGREPHLVGPGTSTCLATSAQLPTGRLFLSHLHPLTTEFVLDHRMTSGSAPPVVSSFLVYL